MKRYLILIFMLIFSTCSTKATQTITCTGHDACKNNIWNGEYNIFCGASNSERTCKSTTLNCGKNHDCTIKTQGSGHDAYQYSTVNAKESNSFKLTCKASGQRDCKSITIWCPQLSGTTCECDSCPNTVTMKCVKGVSCTLVNNANVEYVEPDKYQIPDTVWKKDTSNTGKRPNCDKISVNPNGNYLWGTLDSCKKKCLEESSGLCNIISRYGENLKTSDDLYHCYFYSCLNPDNFTWIDQNQWGNGASASNTYILPVRHHTLESRLINITRYIDIIEYTPYQIKDFGTNTCPSGFSQIINKDECQTAQKKVASDKSFQGIPHPEKPVSGCYYDTLHNRVYLPPDTHETGSNHMAPICQATCETFDNIDAADPLVNFCIDSIPIKSKLQKSSNRAFQIKSWNSGCQKRKDTLNKCKTACNSPQGCCGVTCQSNSCSGGSCCAASKNICKKACEFYFEPVSYNVIDVYQNITKFNNLTQYLFINKTNWINKTKWNNITNINWINKTRWDNITNINWINKTRWNNITNINWINKTRLINKTRWINKENIILLNKTRWVNLTKIHWLNKTRWVNLTKIQWINKTKTNWINKDKINWINKTKINWINKEKINWINKTKIDKPERPNYGEYDYSQKSTTPKNITNCTQENKILNTIYMYGFFIAFGLNFIMMIIIMWKCALTDFIDEIIDEFCCCSCFNYFKSNNTTNTITHVNTNSNNSNNSNLEYSIETKEIGIIEDTLIEEKVTNPCVRKRVLI